MCVRVFCFGFFSLDKQLLQAILHLSTLELSIEMAQTKKEETHTHKNNSNKGKKNPNYKLWNRCPTSLQQ